MPKVGAKRNTDGTVTVTMSESDARLIARVFGNHIVGEESLRGNIFSILGPLFRREGLSVPALITRDSPNNYWGRYLYLLPDNGKEYPTVESLGDETPELDQTMPTKRNFVLDAGLTNGNGG